MLYRDVDGERVSYHILFVVEFLPIEKSLEATLLSAIELYR